jgi:hypothetical protein
MREGARVLNVRPTAIRCGACRHGYDEQAWQELPLERVIEPTELHRTVTRWPADVRIEVRRCHACGRSVSAKRRVPPTRPSARRSR